MKEYVSSSLLETEKIAKDLLSMLEGVSLILLQGDLGAGKTAFAQCLLKQLGAQGPFTSPTFLILKHYALKKINAGFDNVFHLDCYRVTSADIQSIGWDEIINNPKNLVIVEWPEKISEIIPLPYYKVSFQVIGENQRKIKISFNA